MVEGRTKDAIRTECWDKALYAFATASIYERRACSLRRKIRVLTFLGIGVPMLVGSTALSFDSADIWFRILITASSIVLIIQLMWSVWSLIARWDDNLAYALESISDNHRLAREFRELGKNPPADLETRYAIMKVMDDNRRSSDEKQGITEKEKRYGHRAGLRQFQRACTSCNVVPNSLNSSECNICGNF